MIDRARDWFIHNSFIIVAVCLAIAGGFIGGVSGNESWERGSVFTILALLLLAELGAMVGRTKPGQWDGLAKSMALARAAIVNYFITLSVNYWGITEYPEWWFTAARLWMWVAGSIGLWYMVREDYGAWRIMEHEDRLRVIIFITVFTLFMVMMALIW